MVGSAVTITVIAAACGFGSKTPKAVGTTPTSAAASTKPAAPPPPPQKPAFDEAQWTTPITAYRGYDVPDYTRLPNCLDVFAGCSEVQWDGLTTQQYKTALTAAARKLCRVELKVVDVGANYDLVEFELLTDANTSGVGELKAAGDLGGYSKYLKERFKLQDLKKKGLKADKVSVGDRVVLVGLGEVGTASGWGATSPYLGVPKGDERYVILRAFGKPHGVHPKDYEFAFGVRNWYIAKQ